MSKPIFETERLIVRRYTMDDVDNVYSLNSDEEVMRYIRKTMSYDESVAFLEKNINAYETTPLLGRWGVHNRDGVFVGSFAIIPIGETTEIQLGYALLRQYWGMGYASELTAAGVKYAIANNIDPLYAQTELENKASQNVLLKNSFYFLLTVTEGDKTLNRYQLKKST